MSSELANRLMQAESAESFLRDAPEAVQWQTLAMLKAEVDRLTGSDLNAAARLSARIDQLAGLVGSPIFSAFADAGRARVLHQQGNHAEANALYENAIGIMRRARLHDEAAMLQKQQVAALKYLGRFDDALSAARNARRTLKRVSPVQLAQLETNVGNVYYQLDNYKKALAHYERARDIFAAAGDDVMRAIVDFSRANIFTELDRPGDALSLLESSFAAFDRAGQTAKAAQCRFHIAYIHFLRGNYNTALTGYEQARERLLSLGDTLLAAWCDLEIAEIFLALNAHADAFECATNAQAKFAELGMVYESAKALLTRGLAALALLRFDDAQKDLLRAREVFAQRDNRIFIAIADTHLAELALRRGDASVAAARAGAARRTFARRQLTGRAAYARVLEAQAAFDELEFTKAARFLNTTMREIANLFAPTVKYRCHHLLGRIEQARRRPALAHFRRAVETVESLRGRIAADEFKSTFLRDKITLYEDTIAACLQEGGRDAIDEAFRLVESAKSRALADLIADYVREMSATNATEDNDLRARLAKLIEDLNWYTSHAGLEEEKGDQRRAGMIENYHREIVRCEKQISRLFRRLESENHACATSPRNYPAPGSGELCATLEADESAIEYFIIGDEIAAFVAVPGVVRLVRNLATRGEVEKLLNALRFQIEKFNLGGSYVKAYFNQLKRAADGHLTRLYELLFAPLASHLTGNKLVIIPHGALHYLPFHALCDNSSYLIDRYEISYSPSARVLKLCREKSQMASWGKEESGSSGSDQLQATSLLAVGVSDSNTPGIEDEICSLSSLFADSLRLTGAAATRDNLLRMVPRARLLHLASHGYFRRDNPMFSFLKLADAHLNFYNLLDLKLNADLVTLSACHTGMNSVAPGDELHGLMRGFLHAGAPSLVVSLWAVNDRSTTDLMREMYSQLKAGAGKRAALRRAQLTVKDAYGHPYYWAAFILMGDTAIARV